ncbi:hypothetical protein M407DRAFT_126606 [Tulasnella calospora MUT 4182]|uniref:Uncharacterized protein n=1 Tax=Tulasnella calospora MUT 4182 TaxID=1051891 RepID=A0A0C3Q0A3_9AGAM|nr:hypothetical protein M407DRAFT_126606 [Tulasnella calospora MUT 4182]
MTKRARAGEIVGNVTLAAVTIPFIPILLVAYAGAAAHYEIKRIRKEIKDRKWKKMPQYWNGTLITGKLSAKELRQMATKGTASQVTDPPKDLPALPPEIIREILMHATDTFPSPFSVHRFGPSSSTRRFPASTDPLSDQAVERELHQQSMEIKLAVSRVSRLWRDIAAEFLYNSIRIYNSRQIPLLANAFDGDERRRGGGGPGSVAWWIREVWIDVAKFNYFITLDDGLPHFDLFDFFKKCPKIVVFRDFGKWGNQQATAYLNQDPTLQAITQTPYGTSKANTSNKPPEETDASRRIELHLLVDRDPFLPLTASPPYTSTIPSIQSLELRFDYIIRHSVPNPEVIIHLPNLKYLTVRGVKATIQAQFFVMPMLESITYAPDSLRGMDHVGRDPLRSLLERHGSNVRELVLLSEWSLLNPGELRRSCPDLQSVYMPWDGAAKHVDTFPQSITHVGLFGLDNVVHRKKGLEVLSLLSTMASTFPALQFVQDLSWRSGMVRLRAVKHWDDPEAASYRDFWRLALTVLRGDLEEALLMDWRGRTAVIPLSRPSGDVMDYDDEAMDQIMNGRFLF